MVGGIKEKKMNEQELAEQGQEVQCVDGQNQLMQEFYQLQHDYQQLQKENEKLRQKIKELEAEIEDWRDKYMMILGY